METLVRHPLWDLGDVIVRAERALARLPDAPVRVVEIARATGVSARTLYRAFARHRGAPPIASLRRARLEGVRHCLEAAGPDDTVTDAALDWGFSHLGRFAASYWRCFGERPSDTLHRARSSGERRRAAEAWFCEKSSGGFGPWWKRQAIGVGKSMSMPSSHTAARKFSISLDISRKKCLGRHPSI